MLAHIGLDPQKDVEWVVRPGPEAMRLLAERKVDAFMGFPPEPQELRAKKIGHMVVNTTTDRPWSQYFCCRVAAVRPRRCAALLRPPPARGGDDQVVSAEDPHPGHGLALPQRAEERAEGIAVEINRETRICCYDLVVSFLPL